MRNDPAKGNLDLIAELDGAAVGAASTSKHGGAPDGDFAMMAIRVVAEHRRNGVGTALYGACSDHADPAGHWMTGVARSARGRGIAVALKQAQIAAAREAGWKYLRTHNDLGNAPMRRVNEKLGYARKFEWAHLAGPLLRR